jgi:dihydropteroate synthase
MTHQRARTPTSFDDRFPGRACCWQTGRRSLELPPRPLLMGILNVTPDSFSDAEHYVDAAAAVEHGLKLAEDGADLLDVGGESTRPYAQPVPVEEELRRVMPVVEWLARESNLPISIDTRKAVVARAAIEVGAEIINDITGLEGDAEMIDVAAATGVGVCVMHMQGTPETMQDNPTYENVLVEVHQYLRDRRDALEAAGVARERICLDPGIGFGKKLGHNLTLLGGASAFHDLGCPLLVGHSRKSFLAKLVEDDEADRLHATLGVALSLAAQGVQVLRVHDVRAVRDALVAFEATGGIDRLASEG